MANCLRLASRGQGQKRGAPISAIDLYKELITQVSGKLINRSQLESRSVEIRSVKSRSVKRRSVKRKSDKKGSVKSRSIKRRSIKSRSVT